MPDREIAVVHQCEKDILPIIRRTRPGHTLPYRHGIEHRIHLLTELPRFRIEVNLTKVILLILIMGRILLLLTSHII